MHNIRLHNLIRDKQIENYHKYSQSEIARHIGMKQPNLSTYINFGHPKLSEDKKIKIADYLGVRVKDIF